MTGRKLSVVLLAIGRCSECPHADTYSYSLDGFDRGKRYKCRKANDRMIADWVEWNEKAPTPPEWCPLRSLETKAKKGKRND